jgi:hypothetical protein
MSEAVICKECGQELKIGDFPYCGRDGRHESIYPQFAQSFSPVVVHKSADGSIRFPAHADAPVPKGFQKVELTNIGQVRKFEKEVNVKENALLREGRYKERADIQAGKKIMREAFKERVKGFSPRGKRFAENAMAYSDQRKSKRDVMGDTNFHIEAFSFDSSNREAYQDAKSDWQRRKS